MKRFLSLLVLILLFNSCDDGDINVVSLDFASTSVSKCGSETSNFFIYTVKDKRSIILKIPEGTFDNKVTLDGQQRELLIDNSSIKVIYREYSDNITTSTICSDIPAAYPTVTKEWIAKSGGKVIITVAAVKTENATDGSNRISSYNYTISFKDIAFATGDGEQRNDVLAFGVYNNIAKQPTAFNTLDLKKCDDRSLYYKFSGNEALALNVDDAIFQTAKNNLTIPQTIAIDGTTNTLRYIVLEDNSLFTISNFCGTTPTPFTPVDLWVADNGGVIQVTASDVASVTHYEIKFNNVILSKDNTSFKLGTSYLFGIYPPN